MGVRDEFHAIIQTAVAHYVDQLVQMVGKITECQGITLTFASSVDLQFHAEVPAAFPIKYRLRLVIVVANAAILLAAAVAGIAPGAVVIIGLVVGIVIYDHSAAVLTSDAMPVIATLTQGSVTVTGIVILPNSFPAPLTAYCFRLQTDSAKQCIIKFRQLRCRVQLAAHTASSHFFFQDNNLHNKISAWGCTSSMRFLLG